MTRLTRLTRLSILIIVVVMVAISIAQTATATPQDVSWQPPQIRSSSPGLTAVYSDVAYDSNGKIHIAWIEYGPTDADPSRVLYTNNVAGAWLPIYEVSASAGRHSNHILAIETEQNRVHIMYLASDLAMSHRYLTLSGANPAKSPVTKLTAGGAGAKGYNPNMTRDSVGRIHSFWISNETGQYQVRHRIWSNGVWEPGTRIVRSDGVLQTFPKSAATNDGRVHVIFLGGGLRYSVFSGNTWTSSNNVTSASNLKQAALASDGSTLLALYTAQPGNFHNVYYAQGLNGNWTAPTLFSSGASYDEFPEIFYSPANNKGYALWISGPDTGSTRVAVREVTVAGGFGAIALISGNKASYPRGAGGSFSVSTVWQDKTTGVFDVRHSVAPLITPPPTETPTPVPPTATPIPAVNFALTRTSGSPTTNPNINASLTGFEGSPNEMRYSATPFAANDTTVGWIGLQTAITVNTSSTVANCGVTIYAQVRNTATGQVSAVKSVSAVVDTAVQSQAMIYTMEHAPQPRPASTKAPNEQNFAPDGADPNYTRSMTFVYRIPQEPAPCVGIKSYKVESFVRSPSPFPSVEEGIAPFQPFSTGADVGGIGLIEQTVTANVVLTDTLNNQAAFAKTVFYDDDPPILANGGSISFTNGLTSSISVVPITFNADVTDDGYTNSAPANQKYWGVWVVATADATMPTPAVFAQYGRVHYVASGSEQVDYISLTNDSAPALRQPGPRFVHIRFLDGAGNYSEQGITSPQITLSDPFQEGLRTYLPVIAR